MTGKFYHVARRLVAQGLARSCGARAFLRSHGAAAVMGRGGVEAELASSHSGMFEGHNPAASEQSARAVPNQSTATKPKANVTSAIKI